ncbi:protein tyrosine phosphatase family protein [Shewanella maritima]|uniref:protein tyrosine phosphatase family protein n=1 Tax=Shewanella maritima TaxID=2520507 RepID=UPI0037357D50
MSLIQLVRTAMIFALTFSAMPAVADITSSELPAVKALKINNPQVVTAGLPTEAQFSALANAGVEVVINLIPTDNTHYLDSEPDLVQQAGMTYENIEVDWQQPQLADVQQFIKLMDQHKGKSVLVHCAANYRASAFYYLYQLSQGLDASDKQMQQSLSPWGDLQQSFAKYPQWQALIEQVKQQY